MPPTAGETPLDPSLPPSTVTEEPTALDRAIATRDNLAKLEDQLVRETGGVPTIRMIRDHSVNGLNEAIAISSVDQPGAGGANHSYRMDLMAHPGAPVAIATTYGPSFLDLHFQNGPIRESGINGFSNESLLAVVIDRLRGFQHGRNPDGSFDFNARGKFACRENALALTDLESALMWLQKRTRDRIARGVEGKSVQ